MALYQLIFAIFFTLTLSMIEPFSCQVLKGSVTCLDCDGHYDLSDIKIQVKCSEVKKLAIAATEEDGSFQTDLPVDTSTPTSSLTCLARILGGPNQSYISRKDIISSIIVKSHESGSYVITKPLSFYTSCPMSLQKDGKCGATSLEFGSSKTVDLPVPKEWGLPPTSYYVPFIPIIGIP